MDYREFDSQESIFEKIENMFKREQPERASQKARTDV